MEFNCEDRVCVKNSSLLFTRDLIFSNWVLINVVFMVSGLFCFFLLSRAPFPPFLSFSSEVYRSHAYPRFMLHALPTVLHNLFTTKQSGGINVDRVCEAGAAVTVFALTSFSKTFVSIPCLVFLYPTLSCFFHDRWIASLIWILLLLFFFITGVVQPAWFLSTKSSTRCVGSGSTCFEEPRL